MKLEFLEDLYIEELKDLADAEQQLIKALPKMAKKASAPELREAFEEHKKQTEGQLARVKEILQSHDASGSKKCKAMAGLIAEGEELMEQEGSPEILDAGLIAAAQKVEHYEIAGYGSVVAFAKQLGLDEEAKILHETLEEEKETDGRLTVLAKNVANPEAASGDVLETEERAD